MIKLHMCVQAVLDLEVFTLMGENCVYCTVLYYTNSGRNY